jgi:dipeptidyl aminopeptidase/acylaminoacyl peptidase
MDYGGIMKTLILLITFMLVAPAILLAQQPASADKPATQDKAAIQDKAATQDKAVKPEAKLPPAAPMLSPAICGKGTFLFTFGDQPLGSETFEIKCLPDGGYSASGHTEMKPPGPGLNLNTTLELDKTGTPISSTAKGTATAGVPFDQSVIVKGGTATITTNGKTQELPYTKGAALIGGNIFYMFQFLLARYDTTQGGAQQLLAFPNLTVKVERVARDQVKDAATPPKSAAFDRYSISIGPTQLFVWVDDKGRLAVIAVPAQNFGAVREEYVGFTAPLKAVLSSNLKIGDIDYSVSPGAPFTAEEVTVQAKGFTLAGTLLLPKTGKGPFPAVITITGSGQQTRDEALQLPGLENYKPFRQVAETLASRGIAVLRVDDRGVGKSKGFETLTTATSTDFANDVRAQVDYLRSRGDIDPARIALVGHSEGGIIAPMVAATDPRIRALVLMAGTGKRGDLVLRDQLSDSLDRDPTITQEAKAKELAEQQETLRKIVEGGDTSKVPAMMKNPWMKEFLAYDPLLVIPKVRQPILIIQGELDRQVTAEQAAMIERAAREAGNNDVTTRVFPNLNHLFLPAKTGAVSEYSSLNTNTISDEVMTVMSDWLQQKLKAGK